MFFGHNKSYKTCYGEEHMGILAKDLTEGQTIRVDEGTLKIISIKVSNIGKHGRSKCRIEAVNTITNETTILIKGADETIDVL